MQDEVLPGRPRALHDGGVCQVGRSCSISAFQNDDQKGRRSGMTNASPSYHILSVELPADAARRRRLAA
ncbi:MAG: hypothetical protein U1F77_06090 [Kiritimatiellia bacterium]